METKFLSRLIEVFQEGEDIFIKIDPPTPEVKLIAYGQVTAFIKSLNLTNVDFNLLKEAYKKHDGKALRIAKLVKSTSTLTSTSKFIIDTSDDQMTCYLVIVPPQSGEELPSATTIIKELIKRGIIYGIDEKAIQGALDEKKFNKRVCAATGKYPDLGKDGEIIPLVNINTEVEPVIITGTSYKSSEDFIFVEPVGENEPIAKIIPATSGTEGQTIFGEIITTLEGSASDLTGENTFMSQTHIFANIKGRALRLPSGKVTVEPVLIIESEPSGEIKFDGSIKILCDVESCISISASGDIEIHGMVNDVTLHAGRNIVIHGSLYTNLKKSVVAGGDFIATNISNADISAKNIFVYFTCYDSRLLATRQIKTLTDQGKIIGGHAKAGEGIRSSTIGSEPGMKTEVSVATKEILNRSRGALVRHYSEKLNEVKKIEALTLKKVEKILDLKKKYHKKFNQILDKISEDIGQTLKKVEIEKSDYFKKIGEIKDSSSGLSDASVYSDFFYPNTFVYIGNGNRIIKELKKKILFYMKEGNIFTKLSD